MNPAIRVCDHLASEVWRETWNAKAYKQRYSEHLRD